MGATDNEKKHRLMSLFTREFPARQNTDIVELSRISNGWETDVYSFAAEYGSAAERARRPDSQDLLGGKRAADS